MKYAKPAFLFLVLLCSVVSRINCHCTAGPRETVLMASLFLPCDAQGKIRLLLENRFQVELRLLKIYWSLLKRNIHVCLFIAADSLSDTLQIYYS